MNTSRALKRWAHSAAAAATLAGALALSVFALLTATSTASGQQQDGADADSSLSIPHSSASTASGQQQAGADAKSSLVTRHSSLVTGLCPAAPYGVCAHLPRHDAEFRERECAAIAALGATTVRFGVSWRGMQKSPDKPIDFTKLDAIVGEAESHGVTILPILYWPPKWAQPVYEHLDEYGAFIEAVVAHYGERFPAIEIWNEENLKGFWGEDPDPAKFALVLKAGYLAAKNAKTAKGNYASSASFAAGKDPTVYFGGTAGVPFDYIRKVYAADGGPFFDAMAVHPYSHPYAPEGDLDKKLENLRALMAEFGDEGKPIVLTEHGWPTHKATVKGTYILLAGLKIARPEQKTWRVAYAPTASGQQQADTLAAAIEEILPPGSSCEACFGARLRERLAAGDVDAVVYPFDSSFPEDTFDDVCEFVKAGGVLVDTGGAPMWWRCREVEPGRFERLAQDNGDNPLRAKLRVEVDAWWLNPALPQEGRAFPTDAAKAAGYKGDPAGERVYRFLTPRLLQPGDEFIPLLTLQDARGNLAVAASVLKFNSDFKGAVVLSGDKTRGQAAATDEAGQARYLVRAMAIAFAEGVERYFWYEFRSVEEDPTYSEDHFGLTHADMAPKPAFDAYRTFVTMRPSGSVQMPGAWHDESRTFFFPQWTRPDGTVAGVLWKTGATETRELRFAGARAASPAKEDASADIRFCDHLGNPFAPQRIDAGETTMPGQQADDNKNADKDVRATEAFLIPVGENPVFFEGGALMQPSFERN